MKHRNSTGDGAHQGNIENIPRNGTRLLLLCGVLIVLVFLPLLIN